MTTGRFRTTITTLLAATLLAPLASPVRADRRDPKPKELENIGVDEHLDAQVPLDLRFRDEEGRSVTLREFFKQGKPVVLSLNYSNCPMLCNLQLTGLTKGLRELDWTSGREFEVVSISIDPAESPLRAAETRSKYLSLYNRSEQGWHFLVGNKTSIRAITGAVGMRYTYVTERNEYAHPAVAVLCTPDGRISRYLYGIEFPEQTLRLSLVEASEGKIGSAGDQLLLFCFHYDPLTGTYAPRAARLMMAVGGGLTVMTLAGGLLVLWSRDSLRPAGGEAEKSLEHVKAPKVAAG